MLPLILAILAKGDADLLARLQRRDPQALAELYDRYGRMVFGLILRIVQDRATTEDLVQETFLRVWNRAAGLDSEQGAVGPWLLAVARNRAIDHLRYRGRRPEAWLELNETENPALFVDLQADPLHFDRVRQVKTALEKLSEPQRQAIELAYFEGMSQSEIADRLGQPLGTVKSWMRRALQQMREELGGGVPA
jgi:RNA polymerase sigma-70 factor (ECF subfamily)